MKGNHITMLLGLVAFALGGYLLQRKAVQLDAPSVNGHHPLAADEPAPARVLE